MELVIANILLVIIMLAFTVYIFKNVIRKINQSAKKWFVDKLQEYNYLVEEKEKELAELNKKIEESEQNLEILKKVKEQPDNIFDNKVEKVLDKMRRFNEAPAPKETPRRPDIVYDISTPKYKEISFFKTYKYLKKDFNLDSEEIIKKFLSEHKKTKKTKEYAILSEFSSKFNDTVLYECSTLEKESQYELLDSVLTEDERKYINIEEFKENKSRFSIREILEKVNERLKEIDPTIYVYTGSSDINYDYIDSSIKTLFYKNMSEGVIIHYKGKIYDYSV